MAQAAKIAAEKSAPQLLALVADEVTREAVSRAAAQLGWSDVAVRSGGLAKAARAIDAAKAPQVMLVDFGDDAEPDAALGDVVKRCGPGTRVLAIGTLNDVTLFRRLAARGVADYLVKPISSEILCDALRRAVRTEAEATDAKRRARIYAVIGARGGVGASTIAVSLAWLLSKEYSQATALIDFDLHFGNVALSLDLEPGRGLRQALEHPDRTDMLLLASALVKGDERLPILAAEESLDDMLRFEAEGANALLTAMAQDYDYLFVDLPRTLDSAARHVLAAADMTIIVTDLSLAALRDSFRLNGLVKSLGGSETIVVGSQLGALHRGEIGRAEFERGLGAALDYAVPFDPKAARAMAVSGKALPAAEATGKATLELRRIAARIAGQDAKAKAKTGWRRWLG
jgi:pilus assembly protein CpaE